MGIAEIQKQRIIEESAKAHFAAGEKPRLLDVLTDASNFFAKFDIGRPLPVDLEALLPGLRSDVDAFNEILARVALNIDVLYETSNKHVEDIMLLTTLLRNELQRLKARRIKLINDIDDKLFSLYNTDGYYYSISDSFSTLDLTDLGLTSAFIDTEAGRVQIPTIASATRSVGLENINSVDIDVFVDGSPSSYKVLGSPDSAFDGLTNTYWGIEVTTDSPKEVVAVMRVDTASGVSPVAISRVEFEPYGMVPVQLFVELEPLGDDPDTSAEVRDFGGSIKTSAYKMSFIDSPTAARSVIFTMRKVEQDYVINSSGSTKYRYIFAAKNITMTEQVYDMSARFISKPLFLDEAIVDDNVIDAVSLVVDSEVPPGTEIEYFVAADLGNSETLFDEYDWKRIVPLDDISKNPQAVVRFEGARAFLRNIKANPGPSDIELIPLNNTDPDLTKRNPSTKIIPGTNVYRIARFEEQEVLPQSIVLEEGINTTRVMHTTLSSSGLDLSYWADYVNGTKTASIVYGRIDSGNEFFYGGDIGEAGRSVYVETFIQCDNDVPVMLKNVAKIDPNSRVWDLKLFLNGREVADMPVGVNEIVVPWKFQQGQNHIAMTINIPGATTSNPNPYIGTIDLMGDDDLFDFGIVKLATWEYVDFFKMQYNEVGAPYTFTIYNNEIVSRRQPTTNLRVRYAKATSKAPTGVRVRADFRRESNNPNLTPLLNSYRLRFLYAN